MSDSIKKIHDDLRLGDLVVGSYTPDGKVKEPGFVYGNTDQLEEIADRVKQHAALSGALEVKHVGNKKLKPVKVKPKKKVKEEPVVEEPVVEEIEYEEEPAPVAKRKKHIFFQNGMGKIKLSVLDVLECDMAFCLVFENDDDLIFTPSAGETLTFMDLYNNKHDVYYTDALFSLPPDNKKLMILFKKNDE